MRTPVRLPVLTTEQLKELDSIYRTAQDKRVRTRAQIILLAAEKGILAPQIAEIVRESDQTVRNCLKRYLTRGLESLHDKPRSGRRPKVTKSYYEQLTYIVRRRPRSLGLPFSMWTLQHLADYMAEQTAIRVTYEMVRLLLKRAEIVMSRPQHKISSPDEEYEVKKRRLKKPVTQ